MLPEVPTGLQLFVWLQGYEESQARFPTNAFTSIVVLVVQCCAAGAEAQGSHRIPGFNMNSKYVLPLNLQVKSQCQTSLAFIWIKGREGLIGL